MNNKLNTTPLRKLLASSIGVVIVALFLFATVTLGMGKILLAIIEYLFVICITAYIIYKETSREKELLKKKKELWQYLKEHNRRLYGQLMRSKYGLAVSIPTPLGREITIWGYHVAHKIYGFN